MEGSDQRWRGATADFTRLVRAAAGLDSRGCGSASLASPGPRPGFTRLARAARRRASCRWSWAIAARYSLFYF